MLFTVCIPFWTSAIQLPPSWAHVSKDCSQKEKFLSSQGIGSELLSRTAIPRNALPQEPVITGLLTSTSFRNSKDMESVQKKRTALPSKNQMLPRNTTASVPEGLGLKQTKEATSWNSRIFQQHHKERKSQASSTNSTPWDSGYQITWLPLN